MENSVKDTTKKKKRISWRRITAYVMSVILLVVAAGAGAVAAVYKVGMSRMNTVAEEDSLKSANVSEEDLIYDQDVINILLLGADKRESESAIGRSDSIMIATMDIKNGALKLTTLMRDMYIEIPGHGMNKFNAAYAFGGPKLTYETIANTFDIKLDGYVVVDMKIFRDVVDQIGGVEMNLTEEEATYLQSVYKTSKHGETEVTAGMNTLTGYQALAYSRIRQDVTGDFGRTDRQRKVLMSIYDKVMDLSIPDLMNLAFDALGDITTDLDEAHVRSLLTSLISMGKVEIEQHRLPLEYTYDTGRSEVGWVIYPDYETNKAALQYFLFGIGEDPNVTEEFNQGNESFITYDPPEKLEGGSTY